MMKRIIALLLALILTVGLLPTVALAAEGDGETSSTNAEVVIGKYNDKDQWEPGTPTSTLPDGVKTVSKTAKPTTNDNEYEVTLQVVLQQTEENSGKAATVLVLDTSVSMAYCAECGVEGDCVHNYVKFNGTPNSNDQYYYKTTDKNGKEEFERAYYCGGNHTYNKHNAGWFKSNKDRKHTAPNRLRDDNIYFKTTRASRLDAAKVAAENFLKTYSGLTFNTDGTVAANQNSRNLGRYVSVVSFAEKAKSVQSWVDVSNSDVYQKVLKNIKGLSAEGGTNLDAGLTYAEYLLNDNTVRGAVKNVIALTDGQPTYCLKKNCNHLSHLLRTKLTIGSTKYCVHGDGTECTDEIYNSTVDTATRVKNVPSKLYTVCFDAGETIDVPDSQKKISVSEYLRTKIATQPKAGEKFAYDASNAEQLYAEFAKITQSIVSGLNTGTVKDTLPTGITSAAFGEDNVKEWKLNEAPFTKNETTNTVGGKQVTTYTYTYTYTVTINPLTVAKTEIDGAYYAPLNGDTTLTVKSGDTDVEIPFPIPAGKVTMPSYKVTYKIDDAQYGDVDTVDFGTEVTVRENPTKAGYSFSGWSTTDATVADGKFTMPDKDVTITGSWMLKDPTAVNVDLNNHIYKTFTSDTADIPNGKLTFNVTVNGYSDDAKGMMRSGNVEFTKQDVQDGTTSKAFAFASDPLTFTAAGEYTFEVVESTTPVINGLTYNVNNEAHLFTIVVDKKENANELYVKEIRVGTAEYTGDALTATLAYATITNNYVEPKNAQVTNKEVVVTQPEGALKTAVYAFETTSEVTVLYPTGNGTTSNTLEVPYGTTKATLLYKITVYAGTESSYTFEDKDASFVYAENAKTVTKNGDYFTVTFEDGAEYAYVYVAVTHAISYDADGEYKARNFIGSQGAETTVTEKDPNKLTINFADFVKKELTATGSKTANDVKFRVIVNGMESPIMMYNAGEEEVSTYVEFDPRYSTVLDVNFASITGGSTETKDFTGSYVEIDQVGIYYFELNEEDGKRTGVTYDDSTYKVYVYVKREGDKLVVGSFDIYKDGLSVAGETITFHNTIDTGKDDYYPIIIPTIINKDTGMLNKTDHFAYVIGYPDGTVHPNGQITRAEVATIFFRLLRDEVRDGAFTTSNTYSDVAYGKWYNNPISTMSALGIITGYPDGTFKPNKPITRAEFAAIAARFDETQSGKSATFSDVIGHWAAKEIGIAYYNDWIKGYPDGTFKPDQNITRAEAMTLINRVLERKPESPADLLTNMNKWTDNMDTSKWYYLDVQEATNSHGYTRKTFNYELWRQMLNDPDWSRYER